MQQNNTDILEVFAKNRRDGIRMLFNRFYRPLVLYASGLIDDDVMAEDLVQEVFVRLWEDDYLIRVESKALSSYLFSSVRNSCYTYGHKKDVLRFAVNYTEIDIAENSAMAMNQEIVDRVAMVIAGMPEQTRNVLDYVLMQDMKYQEVADKLQISLNTVKTLLKNGMRMLRAELRDERQLLLVFILWSKSFEYQ